MIDFNIVNAISLEEAASLLQQGDAKAMAGGTDLIGAFRREIYPSYPATVVNLQTIDGLDYIKEEGGWLKIGAMTKLQKIAEDPTVQTKYTALAQAAGKTASPQIRAMGTIAGNICQDIRCWYMRSDENYFDCLKKGGQLCYAVDGDNRYHSIFGGIRLAGLPCQGDCPSAIHIPEYVEMVKAGDMAGAAAKLLEDNPLPAVTGRVCPHFCETNCNRQGLDEAISIRDLERALGDYILEHAAELIQAPAKESGKRVAVVGSGPAGLSAAFYLRRQGHQVTVYDSQAEAGGMLTYAIPAYRLPKDIVKQQVDILKAMGVDFRLGVRIGDAVTVESLQKDYDAVFLACGAWQEKPTGIKGEELLQSGLKFLSDVAGGQQKALYETQIVCFRGGCTQLVTGVQDVAVLGGGNTAIDVARTLQRMGVKPTIVYRRTQAEMPAIAQDVELALEEGVEIRFLTQPLAISRKRNQYTLTCGKMELGEPDSSGRRRPVAIPCSEFDLDFDAVITAFGEGADTSFVPAQYLNERQWLQVDNSGHAGGNLFGGGDYVSGPSTVTQAMAAGKNTACAIHQYLGGESCAYHCNGCNKSLDLSQTNMEKTCRVSAPQLAAAERVQNLEGEDVATLSEDTMLAEAGRCLNCGCVAVNCSDTAPALVALGGVFVTTKREIPADDFWNPQQPTFTGNVLEADEMIKEIRIPAPATGTKSAFVKFANRATIDFSIVNCAAKISGNEVKICLNAVAPTPYRAYAAEEALKGQPIDEASAEDAGRLAVADAIPLSENKYKIEIAKAMVKRTLLACK